MAVLSIHHYTDIVNSFIKNVADSRESYYLYVGKADPWLDSSGNNIDANPPAANASVYQHESTVYTDIAFGKLISNNNVSYMIKRYDWANNTVFANYDQADGNLESKNFYVLTDNYEVYKCIDNNKGSNSYVKPSLKAETGNFSTSDGYTWKYMYTIDSTSNSSFTSSTFIPALVNSNVKSNAVGGTIDVIRVLNGGTNYRTYYSGYITSLFNSNTVGIDSGASNFNNFYTKSSMYLKSGFGSGQIRSIKSYDGINKIVTLDSPFSVYGVFNLQSVAGTISVGNIITQNVDTISFLYGQGYFEPGDNVQQSDSGANGTVITANSTVISLTRNSGTNNFVINNAIYNTTQYGTLKSGRVSIQPFTQLRITSNTGAFTVGEFIYQNNGAANTANGIVFSANTTYLLLGLVSGTFSTSYQVKGNTSTSNAVISTITSNNSGNSYIYSVPGSGTTFTSDYNVNTSRYIRVGENANNNIRRITAVNSSVITVSLPYTSSIISNTHYNLPSAVAPSSIALISANGVVTNTNLTGLKITYTNPVSLSNKFIVGERVDQVDSGDVYQGANAIVAFTNTSTLVLSGVNGTFVSGGGLYVSGESSLQKALIDTIASYPTVTIKDPVGTFSVGKQVVSRSISNYSQLGTANVVSYYTTPNQLTEYTISPTIVVDGDGGNAVAYSVVNSTPGSGNSIYQVVVINQGTKYTSANVSVVANASYGTSANLYPVISPALGHGYDVYGELFSRYAGITMKIDTGVNEIYKFPVYGQYRKVGIIKNPLFSDVIINVDTLNRVNMVVSNTSGSGFSVGDYIYQPNTRSAALVYAVSGSNLVLSSVVGTFSANGLYANGSASNDYIIDITSNTTANVASANVIYFTAPSSVDIISETKSGAKATLIANNSNTQFILTNVDGSFIANDTIIDPTTNAIANVVSIYTSNGTQEVTSVFGSKFNQTLRLPLTSNTQSFTRFEFVKQDNSNAYGRVISNSNEFDIVITSATGSFSNGDVITSQNTGAKAILITANSTYLRATAANGKFYTLDSIINNFGVTATAANSYPALILADVDGASKFVSGPLSGNVIGQSSASRGRCNTSSQVIVYPDLVRESGQTTYLENLLPFTLSNTSKEDIRLVIKF